MKRLLVLAFLLTTLFPLRANDILANENFSQGTAHWHGDGHEDISCITIQLDPAKWTKVSQVFNTRENALDFSITFSLSSDFALDPDPFKGGSKKVKNAVLEDIVGLRLKGDTQLVPGNFLVVIADLSQNMIDYVPCQFDAKKTDDQTITGSVPKLEAHEEKTLYISFPPGTGTIILRNVVLTPTAQ